MRLHYFQSCENPLDPLRKLGAKVQPKKFDPQAMQAKLHRQECQRFESGDHPMNVMPDASPLKPAHDGTGYIEPEPSVSFADAAEVVDGWLKWEGGDCPVAADVQLEVRHRDGVISRGQAGDWILCWENDNCSADIIAYRVIKIEAEKNAPTWGDVMAAARAAGKRVSGRLVGACVRSFAHPFAEFPIADVRERPACWPAAIAALEALR